MEIIIFLTQKKDGPFVSAYFEKLSRGTFFECMIIAKRGRIEIMFWKVVK